MKILIKIILLISLIFMIGCGTIPVNDKLTDEYCKDFGFEKSLKKENYANSYCVDGFELKPVYMNSYNDWYYIKYGYGHENASSSCE